MLNGNNVNHDFKVGDLVKVVPSTQPDGSDKGHYFRVGDIGKVHSIHSGLQINFDIPQNPGVVTRDGDGEAVWWVEPEALRKVSNSYTVLLLRPDYMADSFGQDTFMTSVEAKGPVEALELARAEVIDCDHEDVDEFHKYHDPADYLCLLLIEGQHNDINPER